MNAHIFLGKLSDCKQQNIPTQASFSFPCPSNEFSLHISVLVLLLQHVAELFFPFFSLKKIVAPPPLVIFDVFVSRWQEAVSSGCLPQLLGMCTGLKDVVPSWEKTDNFPFCSDAHKLGVLNPSK